MSKSEEDMLLPPAPDVNPLGDCSLVGLPIVYNGHGMFVGRPRLKVIPTCNTANLPLFQARSGCPASFSPSQSCLERPPRNQTHSTTNITISPVRAVYVIINTCVEAAITNETQHS